MEKNYPVEKYYLILTFKPKKSAANRLLNHR
jgi:hypothetical protein